MAWVLAAHTGPYVVGTSHIDILLLQLKESSKSLLCRYCVFSVQHSSISIHSCIWELNLTFVYKYKYTLYSTFRHVGAVSSPLSCPRSSQRNSGSVRSFREAGLCTSTYHARRPLPQPTQHAFIGAPSSYSP